MLRGASLLSTLFISACATTAPIPLGDDATDSSSSADRSDAVSPSLQAMPDSTASSTASCAAIIRDLSVDWESRDYWCAKGQLTVRKSVMLASLEKARLQLAELRQSAESIERNADIAIKQIELRVPSEVWEASPPAAVSAVDYVSDSRIIFAHGRVVLGPKGRRAVAALAQRIASAQRITLRGYLSEGEFALEHPQDAERRSVGRSLSVKEAWRDSGIDVAAVTILHHSGRFDAPHVEVVFND